MAQDPGRFLVIEVNLSTFDNNFLNPTQRHKLLSKLFKKFYGLNAIEKLCLSEWRI